MSAAKAGPHTIYLIRIEGSLDASWSEWLGGLTVRPLDCGDTELSGPVQDQAALHGVLTKIRDLNLTLLSIRQINGERDEHEN